MASVALSAKTYFLTTNSFNGLVFFNFLLCSFRSLIQNSHLSFLLGLARKTCADLKLSYSFDIVFTNVKVFAFYNPSVHCFLKL